MPSAFDDLLIQKLARFDVHVIELEERAFLYLEDEIPKLSAQIDPTEPGLRLIGEIPKHGLLELSVIAGDAVHNLRSALDHLAYHLVKANQGVPSRQTDFNIEMREGKKAKAQILSGASGDAQRIIHSLQPYVTHPNDIKQSELWRLNDLWNQDKHRGLLLAAPNVGPVNLVSVGGNQSAHQLQVTRRLDHGGVAARMGASNSGITGELQFHIGLLDPTGSGTPPIVTTLRELKNFVEVSVLRPLLAYC